MRPIHKIKHGDFFKVDGRYYARVGHIDEHEYEREHFGQIFGYEINAPEGQWMHDRPLYMTSEGKPDIILDPNTEVEWAHWAKLHCGNCHDEWYTFEEVYKNYRLCKKCRTNLDKMEAWQTKRIKWYWYAMQAAVMLSLFCIFKGWWVAPYVTMPSFILCIWLSMKIGKYYESRY